MSSEANVTRMGREEAAAIVSELNEAQRRYDAAMPRAKERIDTEIFALLKRLSAGDRIAYRYGGGPMSREWRLVPTAEEQAEDAAKKAATPEGADVMVAYQDRVTVMLGAKWLESADRVISNGAEVPVWEASADHRILQEALGVLRRYEAHFVGAYAEARAAYERDHGVTWFPATGEGE
jgi:hypothetical protein